MAPAQRFRFCRVVLRSTPDAAQAQRGHRDGDAEHHRDRLIPVLQSAFGKLSSEDLPAQSRGARRSRQRLVSQTGADTAPGRDRRAGDAALAILLHVAAREPALQSRLRADRAGALRIDWPSRSAPSSRAPRPGRRFRTGVARRTGSRGLGRPRHLQISNCGSLSIVPRWNRAEGAATMKVLFIGTAWRRGIARLAFIATALLIAVPQARSQFGGTCGCPVIVSDPQIYGRQAEQLTQETRVADLAAQNTTTGDSGLWQSQLGVLNGLGSTMTQSGGLCYASPNAAQQFKADFPGTAPPPVNAAQHMQQLAALTLGTLGGALGVAQQQAAHFQYEDQQLAALEVRNAGVTGRLQAAQVTNEILLAQTQQLLRQLLITLINTEAVYQGARLNSDVQGVTQASQFLNAGGNAP